MCDIWSSHRSRIPTNCHCRGYTPIVRLNPHFVRHILFDFSAFYLRRSNQIWYALTFCTSNNHFRNSMHLLTNTWRELHRRLEFLRENNYEMVNITEFSNEECFFLFFYLHNRCSIFAVISVGQSSQIGYSSRVASSLKK